MTVRSLPSSPYLKLCKDAVGDPKYQEITAYAKYAVKTLLPKESELYGSISLNIFEGIFIGPDSVAEITRKKYASCPAEQIELLMYCVFLTELCIGKTLFIYPIDKEREYMLRSPQKITAELEGEEKGLEAIKRNLKRGARDKFYDNRLRKLALKRQDELELKIGGSLMKGEEKNRAFVARFNEETFFKGVDLAELAEKRLDLKEKQDLLIFTLLYSVSFFGLSFNELYTADDVFDFSDGGSRNKDSIKNNAAATLKKDLIRCSDKQLGSMLEQMGQTLLNIPLPRINPDLAAQTALQYVLYSGAAQMGELFLRLIRNSSEPSKIYRQDFERSYGQAEKRAELLEEYKQAALMCRDIAELVNSKGATVANAQRYGLTADLGKKVRETENAEL